MAKVGKVRPCKEIEQGLEELRKLGYYKTVQDLKREVSDALKNGGNLYHVKKEIDWALHHEGSKEE